MKKAFIASIVLLLSIPVITVSAQTFESGAFYYTHSEGQATITRYSGDDARVTIPEQLDGYPVVAIGKEAFRLCEDLSRVTLPDSVTSIGDSAFEYCDGLSSINLPKGLTSIGDSAFSGCEKLKSVELPDSLISLGGSAFSDTGLTSIGIPDGVTSIADGAFQGCMELRKVNLPDGITSIGDSAFDNCASLKTIELPSGLKSMGDSVFCFAGLVSIDIPEGVTRIGNAAFRENPLAEVNLPDGITVIGENAFYECGKLASIDLPDGLQTIGAGAFCDTGIASIDIPSGVTSIGNSAFSYCANLSSVVIPGGVKSIGDTLFSNCSKLSSVGIPNGVTTIGIRAFMDCDRLKTIVVPDSVTSIADEAFWGCDTICIRGSLGGYARLYAQKMNIAFAPFQATPEEICQDYIEGKAGVSQFITQLNQWEDVVAGYDQVAAILEQNGKLEEFIRYCAVLSAYEDAAQKSATLIPYMLNHRIWYEGGSEDDGALNVFAQGVSEALMKRIYQPGQPSGAICTVSVLWTDDALKGYGGKKGAFVPNDPQKDQFILILDTKSELAGGKLASKANQEEFDEVTYWADQVLSAVSESSSGELEYTMDPHKASIGIRFLVSHPSAGTYRSTGEDRRTVKAYHCDLTIAAYDLARKKKIAQVTFKNHFGNEISVDFGEEELWAELPDIDEHFDDMEAFIEKALKYFP